MTKFSVLCIDDDEADRYLLRRAIKKAGFDPCFHEEWNGDDALQFLARELDGSPDREEFLTVVVFVDVNMPLMSGLEFLDAFARLRQQHADLRSWVVMLSATSDNADDLARAKAHSFVKSYLTKPPDPDAIGALLREIEALV